MGINHRSAPSKPTQAQQSYKEQNMGLKKAQFVR
jgi:hypothetical protein